MQLGPNTDFGTEAAKKGFGFGSLRVVSHPKAKRVLGASTRGGHCSPGSSRLYRLGVSQAQKTKVSGDERPRLRAL